MFIYTKYSINLFCVQDYLFVYEEILVVLFFLCFFVGFFVHNFCSDVVYFRYCVIGSLYYYVVCRLDGKEDVYVSLFLNRARYFLFFCLVWLLCFRVDVSADSGGDVFDLGVSCFVEKEPQAGVSFNLFLVGDMSGDGTIRYGSRFSDGGFSVSPDDCADIAGKLDSYVRESGVRADSTSVTGKSGIASFPGLGQGWYLVLGSPFSENGVRMTFEPIFVYVSGSTTVDSKHVLDKVPSPSPTKAPGTDSKPSAQPVVSGTKLPQTGTSDYPVFLFLGAGSLSVVGAVIFHKKRKRYAVTFLSIGTLCLGVALGVQTSRMASDWNAGKVSATVMDAYPDIPVGLLSVDGTVSDGESVRSYGGSDYLGVLDIPELGLSLPVNASWSYEALEASPCRYAGTVGKPGFVVCAHSYGSHFGYISSLALGDDVTFTDASGNIIRYAVSDVQTVDPYDIKGMLDKRYDFTMFTCTRSGLQRWAVRCSKL